MIVEHIADAFELVAKTNHYLVGFVGGATTDELQAAEQILITRQNASKEGSAQWRRLELALDLIEQAIRGNE